MNPDVLKMRSFRFAAPAEGRCDLLVIAGEHSGDEQSARMVSDALKINPDLKICAFGGEKLSECGAQLLFDMTSFSVVGLVEVLKNYGFFKKLSEAVVDWIGKYRPKAVCFVDYPGFNLHIASILKRRGISQKGGGDVRLLYYISPQIWAWKASRRFKMAELLDSLAVIFPFETKCYADTNLDTHFVGHPFLSDSYQPPVVYDTDGEILLLSGSREIAVSRIFPVMCGALERIDGAKAVAVYPTERIKNILQKEKTKMIENVLERKNLSLRVKVTVKALIAAGIVALAAVPAVLLAQLCGRSFFLLLVAVFQNVLPFSPAMILAQIKSGIPGLLIQAVFVPLAVVLLTKLLDGSKND